MFGQQRDPQKKVFHSLLLCVKTAHSNQVKGHFAYFLQRDQHGNDANLRAVQPNLQISRTRLNGRDK